MFRWFAHVSSMPRVVSAKHTVQRAYRPLLFRTKFSSEAVLHSTQPPPWRVIYPPHGEGTPADDTNFTPGESVSQPLATKMSRPKGEPGRAAPRGFPVKETLGLPDTVYDQLLMSITLLSATRVMTLYSKETVHRLAAEKLDISQTISYQTAEAVNYVCSEVGIINYCITTNALTFSSKAEKGVPYP